MAKRVKQSTDNNKDGKVKKETYFSQFEAKKKLNKKELKEKVFEKLEKSTKPERKRSAKSANYKSYSKDTYKDIYEKTKPGAKRPKSGKRFVEEVKVEQMPLNKYLAHCGVCSRREAVELIKKGKVKVNALVETEPAYKVKPSDYIVFEGKKLQVQNNNVYILLNKPKGYITTLSDPNGRKTVVDLVKNACEERIYPVGRLDRNTSGLLVLTNDGDFAQRLAHPKYNIKKVYQVKLDKALGVKDYEKIKAGLVLDDGPAPVDDLAYVDPADASVLGIQIHIGKNRIVRRIFEHLGYTVDALDRVLYANLTKKNLPRGKWRFLTEKEVRFLKHFKS